MGYTLKLQLDLRFKEDTPHEVIDFLVNKHIYDTDFAFLHGEDCPEEHTIFTVKNQYQYHQNDVAVYRYELFARIFVRDDDHVLIFKFCTYLAQYTENQGFVGYYLNTDMPNANPELLFFNDGNVTVKDIVSGATFTTNWADENDPNL
jgi:hypothetical protein